MEKTKQQKAKDFIINNGVIIVMFILVIYTGLTSDNFLTRNNLMNILMNMSSRLVIALGIAGCVITAGCDLSAAARKRDLQHTLIIPGSGLTRKSLKMQVLQQSSEAYLIQVLQVFIPHMH